MFCTYLSVSVSSLVKFIFLLLGLSKGNAWVEISASFFFRSATVCNSLINTHARRFYWWAYGIGVLADREELMRWKISTNTVDGYKTDTKCAHSVHGRPTLKDEERFRNGLVRKLYERSLYERTFMSEPFVEKHAIWTELCNVNREKHKRKSHRVFRRDREPSRIPIR